MIRMYDHQHTGVAQAVICDQGTSGNTSVREQKIAVSISRRLIIPAVPY